VIFIGYITIFNNNSRFIKKIRRTEKVRLKSYVV